jgi:hypothetical protein
MADGEAQNPIDLFGGSKRIPKNSFYGYLFSAIAVDLLFFWLPGAGDVFIAFCRGMYWLNGYKTDKMAMATFVDMAIEAIPLVEALPGATAFVIWSYAVNVAETSKLGAVATQKALSARAAKSEAEAAAARSVGEGLAGLNGTRPNVPGGARNPAEANPQDAGYGGKAATGGTAPAPITAADKNIGYRNTGAPAERAERPEEKRGENEGYGRGRSVDGVKQNGNNVGYTPTQPIFKKPANDASRNDNVGYREAA